MKDRCTLEELLRMQVLQKMPNNRVITYYPFFTVAVQGTSDQGVHFIIHAEGFDSETLDFWVKDNEITPIK